MRFNLNSYLWLTDESFIALLHCISTRRSAPTSAAARGRGFSVAARGLGLSARRLCNTCVKCKGDDWGQATGKLFLPNGTFSKPFELDESHLGRKGVQLHCAPLLLTAWFRCSPAEQAAMSEKAVAAEGPSPPRQLGIARGGKLSNVSVSTQPSAKGRLPQSPRHTVGVGGSLRKVTSRRAEGDGRWHRGGHASLPLHRAVFSLAARARFHLEALSGKPGAFDLLAGKRVRLRETWRFAGWACMSLCSAMSNADLFSGRCSVAPVWLWRKALWLLVGTSRVCSWGQSRFRLSAGTKLALHPCLVACLEEAGVRLQPAPHGLLCMCAAGNWICCVREQQ